MISKRALRVDSSGIRKIFALGAKMENPVNFSIGQPDFDVPDLLKDKAIEAIKKGLNRYTLTQGTHELREKAIEYIEKSRKRKFNISDIMISSGVSGGLFLSLMAIIDPGDEVIFFDPYFVMYKQLVNLLDGIPIIIDTYPDFKIPADKLRQSITARTKAIIINSPANPTGYIYTKEDIDNVIKIAKEKNILIISDEIYDGFVYDGNFESVSSYYDNVLLLGGFSKTYAMTGWRLGYAAGNKDIIEQMIKIQQYSFVCAPSPFQYAAVAALDFDYTEYKNLYRTKRDLMYAGLRENFDIVKPQGAFYMFPKLKKGEAGHFVEIAIKNNVLLIPGNVFSERNTHFRISFATNDEHIKAGIDILNRIAKDYYKTIK